MATQDRRDQAIDNFEVYEDSTNFLGIASVDLPSLAFLTQTLNGSGIGGNITAVMVGQMEEMTSTLHWRNLTNESASLSTPVRHTIDLRAAMQVEDPVNNSIEFRAIKHIMVVIPRSIAGGSVAPATTGDSSAEYAVRYWAFYIDGKKQWEVDPFNHKLEVNGVDYTAAIRRALGH